MPLIQARGETEERLRASGVPWTILRPDAFMDLLFPIVVGGPALAGQPVTLVGDSQRRHSYIAMRDVAGYAVAALDHAAGQVLPLGGPQPLGWHDVVSVFEQELGRTLEVRKVAPGEPVPGLLEFVAGLLAVLETYDSPLAMDELAKAYGVTPTTASDFVRGFLAAIPNSR